MTSNGFMHENRYFTVTTTSKDLLAKWYIHPPYQELTLDQEIKTPTEHNDDDKSLVSWKMTMTMTTKC